MSELTGIRHKGTGAPDHGGISRSTILTDKAVTLGAVAAMDLAAEGFAQAYNLK